jgi:hypothetical protein
VASQLRALGRLRTDLEEGWEKGREAIEKLKQTEGQPHADAPAQAEP